MDIILKRRAIILTAGILAFVAFLYIAAINPIVSVGISFGLLIILTTIYFKEKMFFAFIFLYPLVPTYFAFDIGGALPLLTAGRLLLIYVILLDLTLNRDKFRNIKNKLFKNEIKVITFSILFLAFSYIMNYFTYPNIESLKILISFIMENVLLTIYVFFRISSSEDIEKAIKCFLFSSLFIAVLGILEFFLDINVFSFLDIVKSSRQLLSSSVYQRLGESRIEGPFGHPLAYCNFLLMAIPMGVYKWQVSSSIKIKAAYFAVILVLLANFLFTLSRGPMLALIVGIFFYFVFSNKRSKQVLFMIGGTLLILLILGIVSGALPGFVRNFFRSLLDSVMMKGSGGGFGANSNASSYRLYLFDLAKKLVTDQYILTGRGMSFFRLNEVYDWVPGISNTREIRIVSVDNYYILKYIEMGFVGLLSTLTFIYSLIYSNIRNIFRTLNKEFNLCFMFIFISYFVALFTVDEIGTFKFLWVVVGIAAAKLSLDKEVTSQ